METIKTLTPKLPPVSGGLGDRPRHILIAGGAGFIGSQLSRRLIDAGHVVICIDNLLTGRLENLTELLGHPRFVFFRHDIIDPFHIDGPIDQIYNLASAASPPKYQADPIHTFKTSIHGSMALLELAAEKSARILQSSTSEVYGDPEISPQREDYRGCVNTMGPRACYDEGKRAAETLYLEMHKQRGVDIRIARIFNTYGPNMASDDGRVISNFVTQALRGESLTLYGTGAQTRSFCFVEDMLDGLMALMETDTAGHEPVNLGNPGEFTMKELADLITSMIGQDLPVVYKDLPKDDPKQRCPDISRAKRRLGWSPKISLRRGLVPTIAYFRDELVHERGASALLGE